MTPPLVIGNFAYAITAAALLVRDMLWLQALGAIANVGFIIANILAPGGPTYVFIAWSMLFLTINLVQTGRLIFEKRDTSLSQEDRDLHISVFPNLVTGEFRLLLKTGGRRDFSPGTVLVEQGKNRDDILLVERGAITLQRGDLPFDRLREGDMLGEVAFVADRPFSSRAVVAVPTRVVVWRREALNRLFLRRPTIALGFHAAFIGQLRRVSGRQPGVEGFEKTNESSR